MVSSYYKEWLSIAEKIREATPNSLKLNCPNCNSCKIGYEFIGDDQEKVGYFLIWCNDCLEGVHISRIKIPERAKIIPFEASSELISHIPNFKKVSP